MKTGRMNLIKIEDLSFSYDGKKNFLENCSLTVGKKDFVSIIGRNGSGKTTFIKLLAGIFKPTGGKIFIKEKDISHYSPAELSKTIAYLPQNNISFMQGIKVSDFLLLGRYSSKKFFSFSFDSKDREVVANAMKICGTERYAEKNFELLSGGERQKVLITLMMVQLDISSSLEDKILIIDEPLTYLDVNNQIEIFHLLSRLNRDNGLTIIVITHELNYAMKYTSKCALMDSGRIAEYDIPEKVINEKTLKKHFLINSQIVSFNSNPLILYDTIN